MAISSKVCNFITLTVVAEYPAKLRHDTLGVVLTLSPLTRKVLVRCAPSHSKWRLLAARVLNLSLLAFLSIRRLWLRTRVLALRHHLHNWLAIVLEMHLLLGHHVLLLMTILKIMHGLLLRASSAEVCEMLHILPWSCGHGMEDLGGLSLVHLILFRQHKVGLRSKHLKLLLLRLLLHLLGHHRAVRILLHLLRHLVLVCLLLELHFGARASNITVALLVELFSRTHLLNGSSLRLP